MNVAATDAPPRSQDLPLYARIALVTPDTIEARLEALRKGGKLEVVPNTWQIFLGVIRMWHRMIFRSNTVGTSSAPVRSTLRARMLSFRPLRFPFLLRERAVAPLDFSGLASSRERVFSHLLGAHHDQNQFVYDLEMLSLLTGEGETSALVELLERAREVVELDTPRSRFLRDLTVFEGYHEHLVEAVRDALEGRSRLSDAERVDPDISFRGYLAWCAKQPPSPSETIALVRSGRYTIEGGAR